MCQPFFNLFFPSFFSLFFGFEYYKCTCFPVLLIFTKFILCFHLQQTINKKNSKLQKNTDRKIQNAITAATRVDQKLKKMKQTTDKKLKDTKGKIENKVKAVRKLVSVTKATAA